MIDNARLIVARQQFTVECDQFAELQTAFSIRESIRDLVLSFVQLDLHLSGGRIVGEVALQIERRPFVLLVWTGFSVCEREFQMFLSDWSFYDRRSVDSSNSSNFEKFKEITETHLSSSEIKPIRYLKVQEKERFRIESLAVNSPIIIGDNEGDFQLETLHWMACTEWFANSKLTHFWVKTFHRSVNVGTAAFVYNEQD